MASNFLSFCYVKVLNFLLNKKVEHTTNFVMYNKYNIQLLR